MNNFKVGTTVTYTINILVDEVAPAFDATDSFNLIFKVSMNDTDEEAVINKVGTKTGTDGEVQWVLSASETDIEEQTYHYEIKWTSGTAVYIVEQSTVTVQKRVHDV